MWSWIHKVWSLDFEGLSCRQRGPVDRCSSGLRVFSLLFCSEIVEVSRVPLRGLRGLMHWDTNVLKRPRRWWWSTTTTPSPEEKQVRPLTFWTYDPDVRHWLINVYILRHTTYLTDIVSGRLKFVFTSHLCFERLDHNRIIKDFLFHRRQSDYIYASYCAIYSAARHYGVIR